MTNSETSDSLLDHTYKNSIGDTIIMILCVGVILFGLWGRFASLNKKFVTTDEVNTSTAIRGGPPKEYRIYDKVISVKELLKYRQIRPGSNVFDTLDYCRLHPHNPPLYFLTARLWQDVFRGDEKTPRLVAAFISVLTIPCFFLLSLELFRSRFIAWIITALAAVSPGFIQLAQYPRPYSLWMVLTLLSSALLLRATRRGGLTWGAYTVAMVFSLYTHLSALRVLLSHLFYGCAQKFFDRKFPLSRLLVSVVVSLIVFLPWLLELNANLRPSWRGIAWFTERDSNAVVAKAWCEQASELFFDIHNISVDAHKICSPVVLLTELALFVLFLRRAPAASRNFLLLMYLINFATLAVTDLLFGADRSSFTRYMVPTIIALQLMIGFGIATVVQSGRKRIRCAGIALLFVALAVEILSCWSVLPCKSWWHYWGFRYVQAGYVVNHCKAPIVLGWRNPLAWPMNVISEMTVLRDDGKIGFSNTDDLLPVPEGVTDVFIWQPTKKQLEYMKNDGRKYVQRSEILWQLVTP